MIISGFIQDIAEREGFEPSDRGCGQRFSRPPHSTTLASLPCLYFKEQKRLISSRLISAEKEGFEPPVHCCTTVFKTAAIDHSAISPLQRYNFFFSCKHFFKKKYFLSKTPNKSSIFVI